jgi:hypothetical protein
MYEHQSHRFDQQITTVEKKWLKKLFAFIKEEFSSVWLPSHDQTHHYRVWMHAKSLLNDFSESTLFIPENKFLESLIICCFFHDVGLTVTLDKRHGKESRKICERYFDQPKEIDDLNFPDILNTIEQHDEKNYVKLPDTTDHFLHTLLSVSDDIDAFGAIGVLRYFEIYWLRNIPFNEIPQKVISNASMRFDHFKSIFPGGSPIIDEYIANYQYLIKFYTHVREENSYIDNPGIYSRILQNFITYNIVQKNHFTLSESQFGKAAEFYSKLHDELEKYNTNF